MFLNIHTKSNEIIIICKDNASTELKWMIEE